MLTAAMHNGSKDLPMHCPVTPQLVGDQLPGWPFLMLQHLTKKPRCCSTVSTLRHENIDYVSILIDCSPQEGRNTQNTARPLAAPDTPRR